VNPAHPAMAVPCPHCGAGAGQACKNKNGAWMGPHQQRREALVRLLGEEREAEEAAIQAQEAAALAAVRSAPRISDKRRQLKEWAQLPGSSFYPSHYAGVLCGHHSCPVPCPVCEEK